MGLTITGLKRAYTVRKWRNVFANTPYVAVLQLTGGRSWGRSNMRARVLGDKLDSEEVDARYAVPWAAREAAEQTRYVGLANLFRSSPSAVIFGHDAGAVLGVIDRARELLDGGILVGGRFGTSIVGWRDWATAAELGGEDAVRTELLRVLSAPPPVLRVLNHSSHNMVSVLKAGGGAEKLVRVLDARQRSEETAQSVPEAEPHEVHEPQEASG